jgi:hypothetical protein
MTKELQNHDEPEEKHQLTIIIIFLSQYCGSPIVS